MLYFYFVWFSTQIIPFLFLPLLYTIQYFLGKKLVSWDIVVKIFSILTKYQFKQVNDEMLISSGFILCNHRSWTDFAIDQYYSSSSQTGRILAYIVCPASLFSYFDKRAIIISRKASSIVTFEKIIKHLNSKETYSNRVSIYPEGTRKDYSTLSDKDEIKKHIRYGLLKRIYEHKEKPVQCFISSNKELVLNEKKLTCNRGVTIKNAISKPIYPENYSSFDRFIDEICIEWFTCYKLTHMSNFS
tara:strand:- start:18 stop:749 length:732 start_codon:yes stop_codon:yes gene_type:complete